MSLDRYQLGEIAAVQWSPEVAARFPNADLHGCRQQHYEQDGRWVAFDPPRCHGWHCNRCGAATGMFGHTDCPDKPQQ